jgi:hypothetical protein
MNVGELKAVLDDYGDHVPVVIVVERGEHDRVYHEFEVDDRKINGTPHVDLTVTVG